MADALWFLVNNSTVRIVVILPDQQFRFFSKFSVNPLVELQ